MSKITVLGANGMLGGMMVKALRARGHEVRGVGRDIFNVYPAGSSILGVKLSRATDPDTQYVVNCIGAIKPAFKGDLTDAIYTNAVFPRQLANVCELSKKSLIHITTDCVFDGLKGPYDENSKHNATDEYGKSKSLGEPSNCLVLRTSIIGPEFGGNKKSLLEWVRSQEGKLVNGFTNHLWNGLTTLQLSKYVGAVIENGFHENGTFHLFGSEHDKLSVILEIANAYGIEITVKPIETPEPCDRRLTTVKKMQRKMDNIFGVPYIGTMLEELVAFK